jgi:hypothetical protein
MIKIFYQCVFIDMVHKFEYLIIGLGIEHENKWQWSFSSIVDWGQVELCDTYVK